MKLYRAKLKSRKRIMAEIPRDQQGWWADVCAGDTLVLRDATEADVARCSINEGQSRDPADYFCEAVERGSLVKRIAIQSLTEITDRRAAPAAAQLDAELPPLTDSAIIGIFAKGDALCTIPMALAIGRAIESEAVAPYAERIRLLERELAERKPAGSIDDHTKFHLLLGRWLELREYYQDDEAAAVKLAWGALIAYIDGHTAGTAPDRAKHIEYDAVSTMLWLYRRLPRCYERPPNVENPIRHLARIAGFDLKFVEDSFAERAAAPSLSGTEEAK